MVQENSIVISARGLSKEFRDFWFRPKARAVQDFDFDLNRGEVLGLLGPNGSGKSTTVKMILGLLYPTAGVLRIFDHHPSDVRTKRRIGYLPEESYLYKYLTATETLDFFGALFDIPAPERKNRIDQLLSMVGLSHAARRPVGEFSKGMQRRIGLAQAMINDPDLLILDEPTSGLDPIGCRDIKDLILFLKKRGKTVLVTSHLLGDIEDICDRVIILYGGRVRATGTLSELLTVPEKSRITMPALGPEATERVLTLLRAQLVGEAFSIDHPRKTLEEYFLDVVEQAQRESVETSGVVEGSGIAAYLKPEFDGDILRQLSTDPAVPKSVPSEPASRTEPLLNPERIAELAGSPIAAKPFLDGSNADGKTDGTREDVNRKLAEILGETPPRDRS
jgi:ABC-2 type transport system ATP-binding protein